MLRNLGGDFSLKVKISGVAVIFFVFIQKASCTWTRLYAFSDQYYNFQSWSLEHCSRICILTSWID